MANCDVHLELDPTNIFRAGEPLRGILRIRTDSPVGSKAVQLEVGWKVRGHGNPGSTVTHTAVLHTGPIQRSMNLPFEVPLPNGPVSHAGARFTVGWTATARVDINWAIDPKDSVEFTLLPSASAEEPYHYGFVAPQLGADSQQPAQAAFGAPAMILGGFGAIGLILASTGAVQREWGADALWGVVSGHRGGRTDPRLPTAPARC